MIDDPYNMYYGNIIYKNIYLYGLSLKLNGRGASSVSVTSGGLSWNETERVRIYNIRLKIHSKNEPVTSSDVSWSKHVTHNCKWSPCPSKYSNGFDPTYPQQKSISDFLNFSHGMECVISMTLDGAVHSRTWADFRPIEFVLWVLVDMEAVRRHQDEHLPTSCQWDPNVSMILNQRNR